MTLQENYNKIMEAMSKPREIVLFKSIRERITITQEVKELMIGDVLQWVHKNITGCIYSDIYYLILADRPKDKLSEPLAPTEEFEEVIKLLVSYL